MPTTAAALTCVSGGVGGGGGTVPARASAGGGSAREAAVDLSCDSVEAGIPMSSRISSHGLPMSGDLGRRGLGATVSVTSAQGFPMSGDLGRNGGRVTASDLSCESGGAGRGRELSPRVRRQASVREAVVVLEEPSRPPYRPRWAVWRAPRAERRRAVALEGAWEAWPLRGRANAPLGWSRPERTTWPCLTQCWRTLVRHAERRQSAVRLAVVPRRRSYLMLPAARLALVPRLRWSYLMQENTVRLALVQIRGS